MSLLCDSMAVSTEDCRQLSFIFMFLAESEFWLAIGKIILALGLLLFTFVTMLGGNPLHDRFGFRSWDCEFVWTLAKRCSADSRISSFKSSGQLLDLFRRSQADDGSREHLSLNIRRLALPDAFWAF